MLPGVAPEEPEDGSDRPVRRGQADPPGSAGRIVSVSDPRSDLSPYDAILLLSFGGPEGPDDVMPFLENVTRGRGIPAARLQEVAGHYFAFGGRSPINDQNRALLAALRAELRTRKIEVPIHWGNRNWAPFVTDALREAHDAGARRILALTTSAYPSYSSCRQYLEDIDRSVETLAGEGRQVTVDKIRHFGDHPGFVAAVAEAVVAATGSLPEKHRGDARVIFVTHSIPVAMNEHAGPAGGGYVAMHRDVCEAVAAEAFRRLGRDGDPATDWDLVYCSRSGPPTQPWLEPDVGDHLAELAAAGVEAVVVVPVGFVSDHMEVVFDLDTEARETADELGLAFARAATAGTHPAFVSGLVDLLVERAGTASGEAPERPATGRLGPWHDECPLGCCPNLRARTGAAAGTAGAGTPAVRA
jgi:ferrochelatase